LERGGLSRRAAPAPNRRWSLDFVADQLTDGRRFRIRVAVDGCTPECLARVDTSISGRRAARELDDIIRRRGRRPGTIVNNVTELTSNAIWPGR
jgi:putative transposase